LLYRVADGPVAETLASYRRCGKANGIGRGKHAIAGHGGWGLLHPGIGRLVLSVPDEMSLILPRGLFPDGADSPCLDLLSAGAREDAYAREMLREHSLLDKTGIDRRRQRQKWTLREWELLMVKRGQCLLRAGDGGDLLFTLRLTCLTL
jgi:hypothetical protein